MAFHEAQFPMKLALGATGGPEWRTDVITLASGREVRNAPWARGRRRWSVGSAITTLADMQELVTFFEARAGRLHGFRFRDPVDHLSCAPGQAVAFGDQSIGTGDGQTRTFQLQKTQNDTLRVITKPVSGSVQIGINGTPLEAGWSVDITTGEVTFELPPLVADQITAGFAFDCAVRFDDDQIQTVIEAFGAGRIAPLTLIELAAGAS